MTGGRKYPRLTENRRAAMWASPAMIDAMAFLFRERRRGHRCRKVKYGARVRDRIAKISGLAPYSTKLLDLAFIVWAYQPERMAAVLGGESKTGITKMSWPLIKGRR